MKSIRKTALVMVTLFLIIALTGCVIILDKYFWARTHEFINKQSAFDNTGQSTAYFEGNIYYVSQEGKHSGVYRVRDDGTEEQLIFAATKISRITVNNNGDIYFVADSGSKQRGIPVFLLYKYSSDSGSISEVEYGGNPLLRDTIIDGFVLDSGEVVVDEQQGIHVPMGMETLVYVCGGEKAKIKQIEYKDEDVISVHTIVQYENYIVSSMNYDNLLDYPDYSKPKCLENLIAGREASFISLADNKFLINDADIGYYQYFSLLGIKNDDVFAAANDRILILDKASLEVKNTIYIDNKDFVSRIGYMYFLNSGLFGVGVEQDSENKDLYSIAEEDGEMKLIFREADEDEKIVHLSDEGLITVDKHHIYLRELKNEGLGEKKVIAVFFRDLLNNYAFEVSGNWLFIYKVGEHVNPNVFILRINTNSYEVVKAK